MGMGSEMMNNLPGIGACAGGKDGQLNHAGKTKEKRPLMAGLGYSVILRLRDLVILGFRKSQYFDAVGYLAQKKSQNPAISDSYLTFSGGSFLGLPIPNQRRIFRSYCQKKANSPSRKAMQSRMAW